MRNNLSRSIIIILLLVFTLTLFGRGTCHAFWVWTPDAERPVNPKYAVKDTPGEQFDWAMRFFKNKEFQRAADEFIRLTVHYVDSDLAPEAQYYAGRAYEELGKYWYAYENYQKTIDNYPYTKRMEEISEREFQIANHFRTKASPRLMELELNLNLERAIMIYKKIIENAAFGDYADRSWFYMAECYRRQRKYAEAVDSYDRLLSDYPNSPLLSEARIQVAETTYEASLDPEYDQASTDRALEKFQKIAATNPQPEVAEQADEVIATLRNKKAESIMTIANFYERRKKYQSAVVYYREVVEEYPETASALIAGARINKLQAKIDKTMAGKKAK